MCMLQEVDNMSLLAIPELIPAAADIVSHIPEVSVAQRVSTPALHHPTVGVVSNFKVLTLAATLIKANVKKK